MPAVNQPENYLLDELSGDFRRAEMVKAFIRFGEYRVRFGEH